MIRKLPVVVLSAAKAMLPGGRHQVRVAVLRQELQLYAESLGLPRDKADVMFMTLKDRGFPLAEIDVAVRRSLLIAAYCQPTSFVSAETLRQQYFMQVALAQGRLAVQPSPRPDQQAHDRRPDDCWRCDAKPAEGSLGLCSPCLVDLKQD